MKIIWCHSHFLNWMGSSKFIFEVVKRLSKKHEVVIAASVFSPESIKNFRSIGIKTYPLNNKSTNSILYWLNLKRNIIKESEKLREIAEKDDVIITSMFPMNCIAEKSGNFHIQCCWEPYALFHDKNYISGFNFVKRIFISLISVFYKKLDLHASKTSDRIITLSNYNKDWIKRVYRRNDAMVSYEGVDATFFKRIYNRRLENRYKDRKTIFHSTDFTAIKGTKYLIEAFPKILKTFPNSILLISSTIQNLRQKEKYLRFAETHGFSENIKFLGKLDYRLLPAYYSLADIVVQPSIKQNMSLPVKEAMACETPVVASKESYEQMPDGEAGLLVNSKKTGEIAKAVNRMFRDQRLATKMGKYGRKFVLRKFTWDAVTGVFEKAINFGSDKDGAAVTKPFFSVITCTRNSQKYLPMNIKSVKSQTFKDYEHIFVDSFSTDKTLSLEEKHVHANPRAKIILIRKMGISRAMNEGVKNAMGEYIIHLHSDDYFHNKSTLGRVYKFLSESGFPDWIYGKIQVVEKTGKKAGTFPEHKLLQISSTGLLKLFNFVPHQSVFIKKKIFEKFGYFNTKLSSNMDYDLWLRISPKTRWLFFNKIISNYTIHSGAQSSAKRNLSINNLNEDRVVKKHLNTSEYLLHKLVKVPIDFYNKTLR